jgi:hypothetical protein
VTKLLRELLPRVTLPAVLLVASAVNLALTGSWPAVAGLAVAGAVYVLTSTAHLVRLVRELEDLRDRVVKIANRFGGT